jgi:hypothetical protein
MIAGEQRQAKDKMTLELAVSCTALVAQTFDIPTFYVSYSSLNTSIPFFVSLNLIEYVFKKFALALATALTIELTKINLLPVTEAVNPENIFLRRSATVTEEPTAII